jgi:hypothetical protein
MDKTWIPASPGLSDAELDVMVTSCPRAFDAPPAPISIWWRSVRDEWHRRGLHKRFDEER